VERKFVCIAYMVIIMNIIAFATVFTVPQIVSSWRYLKQVILSDNPYVELSATIQTVIGESSTSRLESMLTGVTGFTGKVKRKGLGPAPLLASQLQCYMKGYVIQALPTFQKIIKGSSKIFYQSMLSLLFSFFFIYDKPRIAEGVKRLGRDGSMVKWAYTEIAPKIKLFGSLIGKSLEAQLMIAIWNTFLTTGGMVFLGLPGIPFLSALVFVCSFVPLIGVFTSTLPMGLVALSEVGLAGFFQVLWMVFLVHAVEAYLLNPQIYSSKLKLHPLLVLVSLYITEHIAGVTALFLAVPVTVFITKLVFIDDRDSRLVLPPEKNTGASAS